MLGRGLGQLEHLDQAGLSGSIVPGSGEVSPSVMQANGRERAFDGVGGPQVSPVLCGEVVEGEQDVTVLLEDLTRLVVLGTGLFQEMIERLDGRLRSNRPLAVGRTADATEWS